jgi:hypothetical protein
MMQQSTAFTTIFRVKKCYFHCDMQKKLSKQEPILCDHQILVKSLQTKLAKYLLRKTKFIFKDIFDLVSIFFLSCFDTGAIF